MFDDERVEQFLNLVADKYTATEIVEILELTEWDILEMYRELVLEKKGSFEL